MSFDITPAEQELLLETLRDRMGSLREQVYHSTTSTFTEHLKVKEALLKGLIEKFGGQAEGF